MRKFFLVFSFFILLYAHAQMNFDSLNLALGRQPDDTSKVKHMQDLTGRLCYDYPLQSQRLAEKTVELSARLNFGLFRSYRKLAECFNIQTNYAQALAVYQKAQEVAKTERSPQREHDLAISYTDLSLLYEKMENYHSAINSELQAMKYSSVLNDQTGVNISHLNLGSYYYKTGNYKKAIEEFERSEKGFLAQADSAYLPYVYNGYGSVYSDLKEYDKALVFFKKAYDINRVKFPDDKLALAVSLQNIGEVYGKMRQPALGVEKCLESARLFEEIGVYESVCTSYRNVAGLFESAGQLKEANLYLKKYVRLKDSLFSAENQKIIHEMSIRYESEKKEQENRLLEQENSSKQMTIYYTSGGLLLMLGLVASVYKSNRLKSKANKALAEKNQVIFSQKLLVEEKQTEILDSITYAKRLQEAILPPFEHLRQNFKDIFVFYQPKDIVAGDFYWMEKIWQADAEHIIIAAADCTGHGVPGALVSVVCSNALNRAVHEFSLSDPGQILNKARELVVHTFSKSEKSVRDGMDVSLLSICRARDGKNTHSVKWSGANNPLYILYGESIREIKGDKFPVGAYVNDELHRFRTHEIEVKAGSRIFLFSDGLADQFGGPDNKKYKYRRFKQQLIASRDLSIAAQKEFICKDLAEWRGTQEQVDDILLIGLEL